MELATNVKKSLDTVVDMGNDVMSYMALRILLEGLKDSDPLKPVAEEIIHKMAKLIELANT